MTRIAVVPTFPGLRHFHEGRGFKQWTGDDSKGLMKVRLFGQLNFVLVDLTPNFAGLFACNCRSCPFANGSSSAGPD
jgi:hypothetical protein